MGEMEHITVYTTSSVTAAASHPTINALQWTEDGQLLFLTKTAVYILTPDLGVNYPSTSSVTSAKPKDTVSGANTPGWFRTVLELDRRSFHHWPSESQDWDSLVTGSLDVFIKSVVASPSFLSADAGCVLAVVNTNLELSLWCSAKNQLAGQWVKLQDAISFLQSLAATRTISSLQQTLQTQVVCSSWSRQPDFGAVSACVCDGSLLAIGNRAGSILLIKFTTGSGSEQYLEHVETVDVSEQWITHLTWLPWTSTGENECVAILVYCTSDGAVGFVKVINTYNMEAREYEFGPKPVLATRVIHPPHSICKADDRIITGLSLVEPRNKPVVVIVRPGVIQLWAEECDRVAWSGLRSFSLSRSGISSSSSMLYPPSGLVYSPGHDALVMPLIDGSFHVVYDISSAPTTEPPVGLTKQPGFSSSDLSSISRRIFIQVEGGPMSHGEINRINGMVSFGGFPIVSWAHERSMLSDFSYKHDARQCSTLVVTKIHAEDSDDAVLKMLTDVVSTAKAFLGTAPIHTLRPILFRLVQHGVLLRVHSELLQALRGTAAEDSLEFLTPHLCLDSPTSPYASFRESIVRQLFGNDTLLRLRLKLAITDFCWRSASSLENRTEYGAIARDLLGTISHRVLKIFLQHINLVAHLLTRDDLPFVLRIVIQCMLPDAPNDLSAEAQNLANKVTTLLSPAEHDGISSALQERCPACGVEIPLTDTAVAICSNDHRWPRCSVTSFILSTTTVQTCLGCARKAFRPPVRSRHQQDRGGELNSDAELSERTTVEDPRTVGESGIVDVPATERGWVKQELLKAVRRCLFCGNNFAILI
ncbi:Transcription factor IIIC subunit delta N-term domain containing protein [Russula decolorans]